MRALLALVAVAAFTLAATPYPRRRVQPNGLPMPKRLPLAMLLRLAEPSTN